MTTNALRSWLMAMLTIPVLSFAGIALADDDVRTSRSETLLEHLFDGRSEAVSEHFTGDMHAALTPAKLDELVGALRTQFGELRSMGNTRHGCLGEYPTTWRRLSFERADLDARISFDSSMNVAGLYLVPPETEQPCPQSTDNDVDGDTNPVSGVDEEAVSVGAEGWPLPGIFARPAEGAIRAAVVFVHGSGAHDADQTIFGNKPFRDLAHGLARHGIASLRYVKRNREHSARMTAEIQALTVHEEAVEDAVAAIDWLRRRDDVPTDQVHVLGHSLGGMLAPRIARAAPGTAGMIVLAGSTRPLEDVIVEQFEYLAPHQGITAAQIDEIKVRRDRVKALARGETVDGPLPLGIHAEYWRDLSGYDPVATARELDLPMLILQGERDYQVTMADFARWHEGLSDRATIMLRSYPELNHLMIAGDGPSLPADYLRPGQVDPRVIDDIAAWLHRQTGQPPA